MSTPLTVEELQLALISIREASARLNATAYSLATRAERDLHDTGSADVAEIVKDLHAAARQFGVVNLLLEPAGNDLRRMAA